MHTRRSSIAFWAVAAVSLLASHDLIWLAQAGPGEELTAALRSAGHAYWETASLVIGAIGLAVGLGVILRLTVLRSEAATLEATRTKLPTGIAGRAWRTWLRLFALVALGFVVQESLEHLGQHGHLIGIGALLGPEYPLALPVIGLITGAAALLATVVSDTAEALQAAIAAALSAILRAPRHVARVPRRIFVPRSFVLESSSALRAPPGALLRSIR